MYRHEKERRSPPKESQVYANVPVGYAVCTAVLGTMTQAMQAERVLSNATIHATVTKISSSKSSKGCTYGVTFPCAQESHVRDILFRAGVTVKKYMGG